MFLPNEAWRLLMNQCWGSMRLIFAIYSRSCSLGNKSNVWTGTSWPPGLVMPTRRCILVLLPFWTFFSICEVHFIFSHPMLILPSSEQVQPSPSVHVSNLVGFIKSEVHEVHGTTQLWQCSEPCSPQIWTIPEGTAFLLLQSPFLIIF